MSLRAKKFASGKPALEWLSGSTGTIKTTSWELQKNHYIARLSNAKLVVHLVWLYCLVFVSKGQVNLSNFNTASVIKSSFAHGLCLHVCRVKICVKVIAHRGSMPLKLYRS